MASIITLCLAPAGNLGRATLAPNHLRGDLFRDNYVRRDVRYTTIPSMDNAEEGRDNLDAALHAYPGKKIVEAHSMGTQVECKWLRDIGPDSDIDPDDVIFVGTGNPERKYGGVTTVPDAGLPAIYGGIGPPADTPYTMYDIARQYEFWCDYPTGEMNDTAKRAAIAGLFLHLDYSQVAVNDPANVELVEGNVHYLLAPTWPVPTVGKAFRASAAVQQADDDDRPIIESAYNRPFTVPAPTVRRITSFLGWNTATKRLVNTYVPRWKPFG